MPKQPGTYMKYGRQARINPQTGREELMDGKWWVDAESLAPYGYDPDSAPPEVVEGNRISIRDAAVQESSGGGRSGDDLNGEWAQMARAAGLGHLVKPGWTRTPAFKQLVQNLGYGHVKMGKDGTFVEQRGGMYSIYDNNGNLISSGQGTADSGLFDAAAQQKFGQDAYEAIQKKGGSYAQQLLQAHNAPQPGVPIQVPGAAVDPATVGGPTGVQTPAPPAGDVKPATPWTGGTNRPTTNRPSMAKFGIASDTVGGGPMGQAQADPNRKKGYFGGLNV